MSGEAGEGVPTGAGGRTTEPHVRVRMVEVDGGVAAAAGVRATGVSAGLKPSGVSDLALVDCGRPVPAAAVQTRNQVRAAPVVVTARHLADGRARAVLLNAGSANVCTGPAGIALAERSAEVVGTALGCAAEDVLLCSTGVIGVPAPEQPLLSGIGAAVAALPARDADAATRAAGASAAARAIMTTDLAVKESAVEIADDRGRCRVGGMVKGSGMIRPDMATMLCVVTTDADVDAATLGELLAEAVDASFNRISVDGCMSTNDAVIVLATGAATATPSRQALRRGLTAVLRDLSEQVVRDGEGATRLARIHVHGARSRADAVALGRQVADSALVRTALAGGDPNWGRIMAALGASPVRFDPDRVSITMGPPGRPGILMCRFGVAASFDHAHARLAVSGREVVIGIDLGLGSVSAEVLTCDLTHGYIRINAEYTT